MKHIFDPEIAKSNLEKYRKHNKLYWILFGVFLALTIVAATAVFCFKNDAACLVSMCSCLALAFFAYISRTMLLTPTVEMHYDTLLNDPEYEILQIKLQQPAGPVDSRIRYAWAITENKNGDVTQHLLGDIQVVRNTRITEETLDLNKCILYIPYQKNEET